MTYSPVQRLGRGGMGIVDLAVDADGKPVAVKRLALHGSIHDMHRARLRVRREAAALATLDHPGVVRLLEVIDDGDDVVLVMPYLSGGTLTDRVHAHGPMPTEFVTALADQLLGALAAAHRAGIVHRDIKPGNVLFDQAGNAYLTDFGVATMRDATSGLTASEVVIGTPEFMAPEQARGERATPASDVFSLGATLRYAATGSPPYGRGDPRVILNRAAEGKLERLPTDLPRVLRDQLRPMLDRRPERRPTAAAAAQGGAGGTQVLTLRRTRKATGTRLWPAVAGLAVLALVAVVATAFVALRAHSTGDPSADPGGSGASAGPAGATTPSSICTPLTYQPCGQPAAPFTNGVACTDGHADYDGDAGNGCEATPDSVGGTTLTRSISANLVPASDIDRYPFHVSDDFQILCDGALDVTLTSPAGVSMRLDVLRGGTPLGTAVSADAEPAVVRLDDPSCLGDDGTDLQARVSWVGDTRTAAAYTLTRSGSY
jgi:hypothetical protein